MYRPHATTPLLLGAFALAVACGPRTSGGSGGSGDASGGTGDGTDSSETLTGGTSTGGASVTVGSGADSSSSGGAGACVDNVANEPWCYRAFQVDASPNRGLFGRFGPGGSPRFFFEPPGAYLVGWDGQDLVVSPQDQPTGHPSFWIGGAVATAGRDDIIAADTEDIFRGPLTHFIRYAVADDGIASGVSTTFSAYELGSVSATVDLDGDGILELVAGEGLLTYMPSPSQIRVLRWSGDGFVYASDVIELEPQPCGNITQVEAGNVDGDEYDDILVFTDCIPHLRIGEEAGFHLFRGGPSLADVHPEFVQTEVPGYRSHVEDVNGDGLDDVIFDNIVELDLFVAEGDGKFGSSIVVWTSDTPLSLDDNNVWEFDFADLDGDGAKEILAGRTVILDPLGSPVFEDYVAEGVFAPVIDILPAGDISGDGIDDIVLNTYPVTQVLISGPA